MHVCAAHAASARKTASAVSFAAIVASPSLGCRQLLNTTVASLAISVNTVLTAAYTAIYSRGGTARPSTGDELVLHTAPLNAVSDVQGLFKEGVIDFETAIPCAMHSLGASAGEIVGALERRRDAEREAREAAEAEAKAQAAEAAEKAKSADEKAKADTASPEKPAKPSKPAQSAQSADASDSE